MNKLITLALFVLLNFYATVQANEQEKVELDNKLNQRFKQLVIEQGVARFIQKKHFTFFEHTEIRTNLLHFVQQVTC